VEETVTRLLDDLAAAAKPADFVDLVAIPLSTLVISKLLGVPEEQFPRWRALCGKIASARDGQRSAEGLKELTDCLVGLIAEGRIAEDSPLRPLIQPPYYLTPELVGPIASALTFSGQHTTAVVIGFGLLLLLRHPEQLEAIRQDPAKLPGAVEEILRVGNVGVNTGGNGTAAYARSDFELDGARIQAGDLVLLDVAAANFDPGAWDDAYRFDIERGANHHVTFGHGKRVCPGAGLARLELQALLSRLIPRLPNLRLAVPLEELGTHTDQVTGGLDTLPVTW
jgi:pentalenolactone synthase